LAKSSGHNLSKEVIKNAIWFDIEKQKGDVEPAVTGMLVDGLFSIIVHDEKLTCGADYSELKLISGEKKSWSKMLTYLKHDVYGLCHLTNWVNQNK